MRSTNVDWIYIKFTSRDISDNVKFGQLGKVELAIANVKIYNLLPLSQRINKQDRTFSSFQLESGRPSKKDIFCN